MAAAAASTGTAEAELVVPSLETRRHCFSLWHTKGGLKLVCVSLLATAPTSGPPASSSSSLVLHCGAAVAGVARVVTVGE